jgi:uncharacterized membrane protein YedE/YeeE
LNENNEHSKNEINKNKYIIKNQTPYAAGILIISLIFAIYLHKKSFDLAFYWGICLCFGFVLQKSRFCFTASFRDPYLTGSTILTRAVLIAFALTSIGFTIIKYINITQGNPVPGMDYVVPISLATALGAFTFGIGMVISGGCASGTFMRIGEGFQLQVITLIFFIVGSLWGARDYQWWEENFISQGIKIYLPDIFGLFGGLVANLIIIILIYILAKKWEDKKM